jgi:hypothetical protein
MTKKLNKAQCDALGIGHVSGLPLGPIDTSVWDELFPRHAPAKCPPCINLKERFPEYRIFWEDNGSYKDLVPREEWPWLMEIRGENGFVAPHGHDILCVYPRGAKTATKIEALPFIIRKMGESGESRFWFHVDHAEEIFAIIKPRRRRRLSPEHKEALLRASKPFKKGESKSLRALKAPAEGLNGED